MKISKVFAVASCVVLVFVCAWRLTQPAYDHSQDAVKAEEKAQEERLNERAMAINKLGQPSKIDTRRSEVYIVVKTFWDENLGVNRVVVEREGDGVIAVLSGKSGTKFVTGEKVIKITIRYRIWEDYLEVVHYCVPLPGV